jgi:hypothetical protein
MSDLLPFALLVAGTFLFAGLVKGVVGLGLPTVAMGLLGLAMPPVEAAALLLVPSLVTNVWQLLAGPRFGGLLRRLWPMMLGVVAGTLAPGRGSSPGPPRAPPRRFSAPPWPSTGPSGCSNPACACRPPRSPGRRRSSARRRGW